MDAFDANITRVDWRDENSIVRYIMNTKKNKTFEGENEIGEKVIVEVVAGKSVTVNTYQSNNYIAFQDFVLEDNCLVICEGYEPKKAKQKA